MIRVAAVGDIHVGEDTDGVLRAAFAEVADAADVLLLCGDLTRRGTLEEAQRVVDELRDVTIPVVAVLGNHDHHDGHPKEVAALLRAAGITVLEGETVVLDLPGGRLGVAGAKGFGGGFAGNNATAFGEQAMKDFVRHTEHIAERLGKCLAALQDQGCDATIALLHYSPVRDTLVGEPPELFPFLGSQLLAEAIDRSGADLALHGHAHKGTERGLTPAGTPVRNVAMPVIRCAYHVFEVSGAKAATA